MIQPTVGSASEDNKITVNISVSETIGSGLNRINVKLLGAITGESFSYEFKDIGTVKEHVHTFTNLKLQRYSIHLSFDPDKFVNLENTFVFSSIIKNCIDKGSHGFSVICQLFPGADIKADFLVTAKPLTQYPTGITPTVNPRCVNECIYSVDDSEGNRRCYRGFCKDPNRPCSNGPRDDSESNCGSVEECSDNKKEEEVEVSCSDSPYDVTVTP